MTVSQQLRGIPYVHKYMIYNVNFRQYFPAYSQTKIYFYRILSTNTSPCFSIIGQSSIGPCFHCILYCVRFMAAHIIETYFVFRNKLGIRWCQVTGSRGIDVPHTTSLNRFSKEIFDKIAHCPTITYRKVDGA